MESESFVPAASPRVEVPALAWGAAGSVVLGLILLTLRGRRTAADWASDDDKRSALASYLREHLTGSDAAIQVVKRLRRTQAGSPHGQLFTDLHDAFVEERHVLRRLLVDLGTTAFSFKRLAGQTAGAVSRLAINGHRDDLSLFRTLEALAIGVQGKRCLWRALQQLPSGRPSHNRRSFKELETMAGRQWDAIEERRRALAPQIFARVSGPLPVMRHGAGRRS